MPTIPKKFGVKPFRYEKNRLANQLSSFWINKKLPLYMRYFLIETFKIRGNNQFVL